MIFKCPSRKPCSAALSDALQASRKTPKAKARYFRDIDMTPKKMGGIRF
jgi:hypothetical protein